MDLLLNSSLDLKTTLRKISITNIEFQLFILQPLEFLIIHIKVLNAREKSKLKCPRIEQ